MCLRHTCYFGYIATIIAVGTIKWVINYEQITITIAIASLELVHTFAVTILWVAIDARCADGSRTESLESTSVECVLTLKHLFTLEKSVK